MDRALILQGREIRPEDVTLIRDWLQTHPGWNRTRLSRELCVAWNWLMRRIIALTGRIHAGKLATQRKSL